MAQDLHVYQIYIASQPDEVWAAITRSEWTSRYFHATSYVEPPVAGHAFRTVIADGRDAIEGLILEMSPPAEGRPGRFVQTWHVLYDVELAAEPPGTVEWTVESAGEGLTRVRLVHRGLAESPRTAAEVEDGWVWVLDSLKSVLETGTDLPRIAAPEAAPVRIRRYALGGDLRGQQPKIVLGSPGLGDLDVRQLLVVGQQHPAGQIESAARRQDVEQGPRNQQRSGPLRQVGVARQLPAVDHRDGAAADHLQHATHGSPRRCPRRFRCRAGTATGRPATAAARTGCAARNAGRSPLRSPGRDRRTIDSSAASAWTRRCRTRSCSRPGCSRRPRCRPRRPRAGGRRGWPPRTASP